MRPIPARPFPAPEKSRRGMHEIEPAVRRLVVARCAGLCDVCGLPLDGAPDLHHRKLRSRGGDHNPANLIGAHRRCHRRVHQHPAWATDCGLMVPATADPADIPLALHGKRWVLLTPQGTVIEEAS